MNGFQSYQVIFSLSKFVAFFIETQFFVCLYLRFTYGGTAVVACVVFVAIIALAFFDRKMLRRMLVIFGATVAQMAVVVAVVWLVYQHPEVLCKSLLPHVRTLAQPLVMVIAML